MTHIQIFESLRTRGLGWARVVMKWCIRRVHTPGWCNAECKGRTEAVQMTVSDDSYRTSSETVTVESSMEEYGGVLQGRLDAQRREVILIEHPVFLHCYLNCHSVTIVVTITSKRSDRSRVKQRGSEASNVRAPLAQSPSRAHKVRADTRVGNHPATVRLAGRKRHARFESSEALTHLPAVARTAVELHECCARVSLLQRRSSANILTAWPGGG